MALLDDEIAKKKAEDALIASGGKDASDDEADTDTDASTDLPEDVADTPEEDKSTAASEVYQPATKAGPSYVLVPLKQTAPPLDTKTDEQVTAAPSPTPTPKLDTVTDEQVVAQPPLDKGEAPATLPQVEKGQLVQPPEALDKGEAPAQLDQVERGTLVKLPAPDLGERGAPIPTAASVSTPDLSTDLPEDVSPVVGGTAAADQPEVRRAAQVGETPKALPPEPVVRGAQVGVTPKAQPVTPTPSEAAPVTHPPRQTSLGLTPDEYKAQYVNPPTATTASGGVQPDTSGQDNTGVANYLSKSGEAPITDSNDSRLTTVSVGNQKWQVHQNAAPYFQGFLKELADQGAPITSSGGWNYRTIAGTKTLSQHSYGGAIDVSQEGRDEVSPAFKKWIQDNPGALQAAEQHWHIYGGERFGDLGHFEWGGVGGGAAQPTGVAGGKPGQPAAGVGPSITGKATTFGYNDKDDSGVGAPKLGQLDTNNRDIVGIAIPEQALRAYVGAHPASWRTARVQVTSANGQQVLVPIVDLGPRDTSGNVVADFTQGLTDLTGNKGEQDYGFRIIPNAGPDVMKDPQAFADEQAAIKAGINTGARFAPPAAKKPSYVLVPMAPKSPQQQQAEQFAAQGQIDTLDELNRNTENPGQFWKMLQQPMPGTVDPASGQPVGAVSDAARAAYADNFKQELTKYAQDFYNEPDPNKAFQRAVGDANLGTFGQDVGRAATGVVGQVDVGINKMSRDSDNNALDRFAQVLHPESDGPGRAAFIKTITSIQDPTLRAQTIGKLWASLDPQKQASIDINGLVNSADNVANPVFQAGQAREIAAKDAFIQKLFTPDPTLRGTAGAWATPIGQLVGNVAMTGLPKLLQASAFASQIYGATRDRVKEEHPDWTDEQIAQEAGTSTFAQLAPQEVLIVASHGIMGPIARWGANPVIRFGIGGGVHLATGAAGGALMQAGANVAEGQPIGQDVGGAAWQGAIQAAPFAVHGAVESALAPRPIGTQRGDTTEIHGPPAPTTFPMRSSDVLGPELGQPDTGAPQVGERGAPIHGAELRTMQPDPIVIRQTPEVTRESVLGPDVPDTSVKWYDPTRPIVTRAEERTAFTPQELASKVGELRQQGWTPVQIQQIIENLQPQPNFTRQIVHLGEEGQANLTQPVRSLQPEPDFFRRTVHFGEAQTPPVPEASEAARIPGESPLGQVQQPAVPEATGAAPVGEAEPWVSKIANRFTAERMATGDLGPVEPGVGVTKEEMLARGLQMGPETINQHVSNIMNDVGGNPRDQAAAIRTEEARLSQVSRDASLASEADPANQQLRTQADNAFKNLTDFHNGPVAKLKSNWHAQGMTLQGELPVDLSTYNGLRDAYLRDVGKPPPANAEPVLRRTAQRVRDAATAETAAMQRLGAEIEKQSSLRRLPTPDQVRENIMKRMRVEPCPT